MTKYTYHLLGKKEKQRALSEYINRSLVLELNRTALKMRDVKKVAENHLLYSDYSQYELFDKNGGYLGLFNVHEEHVFLDYSNFPRK